MGLGARTRMLSEGWTFVPHTIGDEVEFAAFGRPRRGRDFTVSHYVEVAERYEDGLLVEQIYHDAWSRPVALGATVVWETDPRGRMEFLVALRKRFIGELSEYQIRSALRPRLEAIQALTGMGEPNFSRAQEIRAHLAHIPREHRTGDLLGMVKRAGLKDLDVGDSLKLGFTETKDTGKPQPMKVFRARVTKGDRTPANATAAGGSTYSADEF